ncbi:GBP4 protein, partial [Atractosteus spatula]|nr:GBP4 protein [Atractosteus spatula]
MILPASYRIMEAPKLFIAFRGDKLVINEEVKEDLTKLTNKTVVIGIVGKHGTGKSYLLSRFPGSGKGFPVFSSRREGTRGIWLWVKPHPTHPDTNLLLLDTEGLDDPKGTVRQDKQILLLTALLSSSLIYNITRCIDASDIKEINIMVQSVQEILVNESSKGSAESIKHYLPNLFCVLLRDYQSEEGETDEYLQEVLTSIGPEIKKNVEESFSSLKVYFLPTPASKDKLRCLEALEYNELDEDFQDSLTSMITSVRDLSVPKKIGDKIYCTPKDIIDLAEVYINMLNNEEIVCLREASRNMTENIFSNAALMAKKEFEKTAVLDDRPMEAEQLEDLHSSAHKEAMSVFENYTRFLLDKRATQQKLKDLEIELDEMKDKQKRTNSYKSEVTCKTEFERLARIHNLQDCEGIRAYSELQKKIRVMKEEYFSLPYLGPAKQSVFDECLRTGAYEEKAYQVVIKCLEEMYVEKRKRIEDFVQELRQIADGIDFTQKGTTIGNIAGGSAAIAGSILTIVGLALIPVTVGASGILTGIGAGIGVAGAATSVSFSAGRIIKNRQYEEELKELAENIEADMRELEKHITCVRELFLSFQDQGLPRFLADSRFGVTSALNIASLVDDIVGLGAKVLSRTVVIIGFIFAAVSLVMEMVFLVKNSKELYDGCKTEKAQKIREQANQIIEGLDEIGEFMLMIRDITASIQ